MKTAHATPRTYVGVFLILGIVTAIEVFVSGLPLARAVLVLALLALSVTKALLVVMFYMHLKYDTRWYTYAMLFPLGMALVLTVILIIR